MKSRVVGSYLLLGGLVVAAALWQAGTVHGAPRTTSDTTPSWNRQAAVKYLDDREVWWQGWAPAQKDHDTKCISCHTVVPYAMVRPALRRDLGESEIAAPERVMLDSVEKRVSHWDEMVPFYSDAKNGPGKTAEAHATEAVMNAVVLASYDGGQGHLRPITRMAFENAWALEEQTGGWKWQDFHLGPWESSESAYQGAALLVVEALNAPDGFAHEPAVRAHLDRVKQYLRRQYAAQPMMNKIYILWASAKEPCLLTRTERKALLAALRAQQQADGGWRIMALDERVRADHSPEPMDSDGYATGLAVLAMEESGTSRRDPTLVRGVAWLESHQQKDGTWDAVSMNKKRDPQSAAGPFMKDAATAYAALALERQR